MGRFHAIFPSAFTPHRYVLGGVLICSFFFLAWLQPPQPMNSYQVQTVAELRQTLARMQPGDTLTLAAGVYHISSPIVLDIDGITFQGVGDETVLRLSDGANCPVLFVGVDALQPSRFVSGITIRRLRIDGNRTMQTSEHWREPREEGWFTNNGITFREVKNSVAEDIKVHSAASGGIVFGLRCDGIELRRITAWDNAYDGIAWDAHVTNSVISDSDLFENLYSGISWDIDVVGNSVRTTKSRNNGTSGFFARSSSENIIVKSEFSGNEDGVFIADGEKHSGGKGSIDNLFEDCVISENRRSGVWQAGEQSRGNTLRSTELRNNGYRAVDNSFPETAPLIVVE